MNDIEIELINLAMSNEIAVDINRELPKSISSFSSTTKRHVLINASRDGYIFEFAHELAHILNGDTSASPLYYSSTNKTKMESNANKTAIKLLLPYYCNQQSIDEISSVEFIEKYKIPACLEENVEKELFNLYSYDGID